MFFFVGFQKMVSAVALVGVERFHERVGEHFNVAGGFPHLTRQDDGRVKTDNIVTASHHIVPPLAFNVVLQFHTKRTVIPCGTCTTVDFAARVYNSPAFA